MSYPLYPLNGAHWTEYGVGMAADTISRYIEKIRNIDMPEISWDKVSMSDTMRNSDYDIGELMNLFKPLHNKPMPYPEFKFDTIGKTKPKLISISDSYWWSFTMTPIVVKLFDSDNYWFYFKNAYHLQLKGKPVEDLDLKAELFSQDVVIMMVTEATYMLFPYGFIEAFDQKCLDHPSMSDEEKINQYMKLIRKSPDWFKTIREKAKNNGIPVEDQLKADATYLLNQEKTNSRK